MPISESEKKYLQALLDSIGEITIQYKDCEDEVEKTIIKEKYRELTDKYKNLVDDLLTNDLSFSQEDIDAINAIGVEISNAAKLQQLLIAIAKLAAKLIVT